MDTEIDFSIATSEQIIKTLGARFEKIRLAKNLTWKKLAAEAGVTWRTIANLEKGKNVSLDTLIRVMTALGIQGNLQVLLPDPTIRPMERINVRSTERKRARSNKQEEPAEWTWNDHDGGQP